MLGRGNLPYRSIRLLVVLVIYISSFIVSHQTVSAATALEQRSDKIDSSLVSAIATHQIGFTMTDILSPVGSIVVEFCSNTPIPYDSCAFPIGFDASAAVLSSQSGETGFSIHANTTSNRVVLTRVAVNPAGIASVYDLSNITNPSSIGSYFIRLHTFGSTDGTGIDLQNGGVVISINERITVSAEVAPYITFCVAATITAFDCSSATNFFIDFGFLLPSTTSHATSEIVAASNAVSGYSITAAGTTLTSGLNTIPALAVPTASTAGSNQFGFNLRQNTVPSNGTDVVGPGTAVPSANYATPNQFSFNNGDIIASVTHSDDIRKFTVNYITNVNGSQAGGVYSTTISFICLANF